MSSLPDPPEMISASANDVWAIAPQRVWEGSHILEDFGVLISGERILDLVQRKAIPRGVPVKRLPGCTLLPGLIDAHVHLAQWMMPGILAAGVTTIRDVGNDLNWILQRRKETAADPKSGPRILCTGPLIDGAVPNWPRIGKRHRSLIEVENTVRSLARAGVDAIKLYVNLDPAAIGQASRTAADVGLAVLAHLGKIGAVEASSLGIREVEHLSGVVDPSSGRRSDTNETELRALAQALVDRDVAICPTLVVWDRLARINDGALINDRRLEWVHPDILKAWDRFPHRQRSSHDRLDRQESITAMKAVLGLLHEAGLITLAGSDSPWPYVIPGFGLHDELALMVDSGLDPANALATATSKAARRLGMEHLVGTIRPGAFADLLAVEGEPDRDIRSLGSVRFLARHGCEIDLKALERRRAGVFSFPADDPVSTTIIEASEADQETERR
jgi:hypothetical protein